MDDLVSSVAGIAAAFGGVFILLLLFMRRQGLTFTKEEKKSFFFIILIFFGGVGYFFFFEDADFIFRCGKDTQRCDYHHSTHYNKNIRLARSFDLSGIKEAGIVPRKRSCGRHCSKTVYRIVFNGENNSFEMPKDFDFKEDAERQAARAAAFLQTDKPYYAYKEITPNNTKNYSIILLPLFLSVILSMFGLLTALTKIFQRKKKEKYLEYRKKEKIPDE